MAGASPQGDCWFFHDALKFGGFDPTNEKQFYSTIFLEVGTNMVNKNEPMKPDPKSILGAAYGGKIKYISELPASQTHPRAGRQFWEVDYRDCYERYKWMTVMTGPSPENITSHKQIHGSYAYKTLYPRQSETRVAMVPVMVPSKADKYLWVDLTYPLRGIYIPKMHKAHIKYGHMCRYSRLDFRARDVTLKTEPKGGDFKFTPDKTWGWGVHPEWTARFDILALSVILMFPDEYLADDYKEPYDFIKLYDSSAVKLKRDGPEEGNMNPKKVIEYDKLLSKQHGVDVVYKSDGYDPQWGFKCLAGLIAVAASCVPAVGPLLAVGVQVVAHLVLSPENFSDVYKVASEEVPGMAGGLAGTAQNIKPMLNGNALKAAMNVKVRRFT